MCWVNAGRNVQRNKEDRNENRRQERWETRHETAFTSLFFTVDGVRSGGIELRESHIGNERGFIGRRDAEWLF